MQSPARSAPIPRQEDKPSPRRRWLLVALLVALALLGTVLNAWQAPVQARAPVPGLDVSAAPAAPPASVPAQNDGAGITGTRPFTWTRVRVDDARLFEDVTNRSLRLDADDHPHVAYGGDRLYYAWHDGSTWHHETVDSADGVGRHASLALDRDGQPHIAYLDETVPRIKYAHRTARGWQVEAIDGSDEAAECASLEVDRDGQPHIAFCSWAGSEMRLKYAHRSGDGWAVMIVGEADPNEPDVSVAVDGRGHPFIAYFEPSEVLIVTHWNGELWQRDEVESEADFNESLSLVLDGAGRLHLSYVKEYHLWYAVREDSGWTTQEVEGASTGDVLRTSLGVDSSGAPHISYHDTGAELFKYARWDGAAWRFEVVDAVPSATSSQFSLALDSQGHPHLSYYTTRTRDLDYLHWDSEAWRRETVDSAELAGFASSIAVDRRDRPHITYQDTRVGLKYARWTGAAWEFRVVDRGGLSSLALDGDDLPHVSYYAGETGEIRYASWDGITWTIETVDTVGSPARRSSLELDGRGTPRIAYEAAGAIRYARWNGTSWITQTVVTCRTCLRPSLALDSRGRPHLSYDYDDYSNAGIFYARLARSTWITETIYASDYADGPTSLALDSRGRPHVVFNDTILVGLMYAHRDATGWHSSRVATGYVDAELALDAADRPHISYTYGTARRPFRQGIDIDLKHAYWNGTEWIDATIDFRGIVGWTTSLALDSEGIPHVSYDDATNGDLKYAVADPERLQPSILPLFLPLVRGAAG